MYTRRNNALIYAGLALVALAGVALLCYATPEGMGLVNDSAAYLNGARSLLAGDGYARITGGGDLSAITHFPPLYAILLALISRFTPSVFEAAAFTNQMLFGVNIFLVGILAWRLTRRGWAGLLAGGLFASSEALLRVHAFALSEPLFVCLSLAALICLCGYFDEQRRALWLVWAGVFIGLAMLARYVGAALLAAGLLAIMLAGRDWKTRLADCTRFLAAPALLMAAWWARGIALGESVTNRQSAWHPIALSEWLEGLANFWAFLLPSRLGLYERIPAVVWSALLGLLLGVIAGWLVLRVIGLVKSGAGMPGWMAALIGLHLFGYLALVIVSMTVMDASTIFEDRILAPVYLDMLLLGVILFAWLVSRPLGVLRGLALLAALGMLLAGIDDTRRAANLLALDGQGFASTGWAQSQTLAALRELPAGAIYTNRLSAVNILTTRPAYALLSDIDPVTLQPRPGYAETQRAIRAAVLDGRAFVVVFDSAELLDDPAAGWYRELIDGLPVWGEYPDGVIFGRAK